MIRLLNSFLILIFLTFVSCIHKSEDNELPHKNNNNYIEIKSTNKINEQIYINFDISIIKFADSDLEFVNSFISEKTSSLFESNNNVPELSESVINNYIENYVKILSNDYEDIGEEGFSSEFYCNLDINVASKNEKVIIIIESYETYLGGAHGNFMDNYYAFDIDSRTKLQYEDIFRKEEIEEIAESYFQKSQGMERKVVDWEEEGYWFANNQFHLTNNFYFEKDKLIFVFNPYEVASYAQGRIDLEIPFNALQNAIKDKYKNLLN